MERRPETSNSAPQDKPYNKVCVIPRQNGSKPVEIYRRPECQKKHITSDGKK